MNEEFIKTYIGAHPFINIEVNELICEGTTCGSCSLYKECGTHNIDVTVTQEIYDKIKNESPELLI